MEKKLSLIIALKRRNRNSVFRKKANHILAKELGMSAYLFSRLLSELKSDGFIHDQGSYYRISKFREIVKHFYEETNLRVGVFKLLKQKSLNYNEILNDLYGQLILTNVIAPQEYLIKRKKDFSSIYQRTVLNSSRFFKKRGDYRCVDDIEKSVNENIMVSCRLIAEKLSISSSKANKILNTCKMFTREIKELWIDGIHPGKLEKIEQHYPEATVLMFSKADKYKVCFGSRLTRTLNLVYREEV